MRFCIVAGQLIERGERFGLLGGLQLTVTFGCLNQHLQAGSAPPTAGSDQQTAYNVPKRPRPFDLRAPRKAGLHMVYV